MENIAIQANNGSIFRIFVSSSLLKCRRARLPWETACRLPMQGRAQGGPAMLISLVYRDSHRTYTPIARALNLKFLPVKDKLSYVGVFTH